MKLHFWILIPHEMNMYESLTNDFNLSSNEGDFSICGLGNKGFMKGKNDNKKHAQNENLKQNKQK